MSKHIVIESCKDCPYKKSNGGWGSVIGVPYCDKGGTMTYVVESVRTSQGAYRQVAKSDNVIPDDCPLENKDDDA